MGRIVGGANGISSGICGGRQYQRFTATGVWKKPIGARLVYLEIIGGGGSGAGGGHPNHDGGGGGGGAQQSSKPLCQLNPSRIP